MAKKTQDSQKQGSDANLSYADTLTQSLGAALSTATTGAVKGRKPSLVRRDLLKYEDVLCRDFSKLISFEAHALYFPTQDELPDVQYLEDERKILLPLRRENALLGVLLLREVSLDKHAIAQLPKFAQLCLDKLYYIKLSELDELCHLMRSQYFMARLQREISGITDFYAQSFFRSAAANVHSENGEDVNILTDNEHVFNGFATNIYSELLEDTQDYLKDGHVERQSSVGLMVLPVLGLDYIRKFYGFAVAEQIFVSFSQKIQDIIPEDALCTMLDNDSFAILFPGATRRMMENLTSQCIFLEESMDAMPVATMLASMENLSELVEAKLCAGYALFPQDWDGTADSRDSAEIPHLLLHKARTAAQRLKSMPNKKGIAIDKEALHIAGTSLAFKQILLQGGSVEDILPYSQVRVNLGKEDGAQESMCFSVWADVEHLRYKGEILLRKIGERLSEAEILMLSDPAKNIEEGDFLQYIPQSRSQSEVLNEDGTLFYAYRDFMSVVTDQVSVEKIKDFSLSLIRIQWEKQKSRSAKTTKFNEYSKALSNQTDTDKSLSQAQSTTATRGEKNHLADTSNPLNEIDHDKNSHDFSMKDIARELDIYFKDFPVNNTVPIIGSMSFNSLILYHPHMDGKALEEIYIKIGVLIEERFNVPCAVGIASYPFLRFRPADMWDACRKALDYAMLLPEPHVGILNSLAINISADRKFSQGDTFGAVEEYRLALLADGDNILAWNSLGVCLAELGRHTEARNAFEVAYARHSKDAATCYNLGTANLALDDRDKAKEYFLVCLNQEKNHLFARIRLGEIAEKEKTFDDAFEQYTKASIDNPNSSVPFRCLARLYSLQNQKERARELLQLALQKNAEDAVSLQLLAGLYLDGGEDAELAEVLARQSVALLPWRRSAWAELARALEAQGRFPEAAEVRKNSMRL